MPQRFQRQRSTLVPLLLRDANNPIQHSLSLNCRPVRSLFIVTGKVLMRPNDVQKHGPKPYPNRDWLNMDACLEGVLLLWVNECTAQTEYAVRLNALDECLGSWFRGELKKLPQRHAPVVHPPNLPDIHSDVVISDAHPTWREDPSGGWQRVNLVSGQHHIRVIFADVTGSVQCCTSGVWRLQP